MMTLCLLLCGCGGPEMGERSDALRQPSEALTGCTMEAEVTCRDGEESAVFTLRCDYAAEGESIVEVLLPETAAGIRATVDSEVGRTDALLRLLLGEGTYWVRPPYGLLDEGQRSWFTVPLVHWMVDPEDWRLRDADKDVAAVLKAVKPGDIILMHDSVPASVDAALRIVDTLQSQGYTFVTVEELLQLNGVTPEPGVLYRSATVHTP